MKHKESVPTNPLLHIFFISFFNVNSSINPNPNIPPLFFSFRPKTLLFFLAKIISEIRI